MTDSGFLGQKDAEYGILGFGLDSGFWDAYIDPITNQANYSIALARQFDSVKSNYTFGYH